MLSLARAMERDYAKDGKVPGKWLPGPLLFGDDTPHNRACIGNVMNIRKALESTIVQKWKDVQHLPAELPPVVLQGTEDGFRRRLHDAQLACTETAAVIAAVRITLDGGSRARLLEAEKIARGYRISPVTLEDPGILEHEATIGGTMFWVPVMPDVPLPEDWPYEEATETTWRRYAFDRAHGTFLEPHRTADASEAVLRRIAYWKTLA